MLSEEKARRDSDVRVSQQIEQEDLRKQKWIDQKVQPFSNTMRHSGSGNPKPSPVFNNTDRHNFQTGISPSNDSAMDLGFKSPIPVASTLKFTKEQE